MPGSPPVASRSSKMSRHGKSSLVLALLASSAQTTFAQSCISLSGSTACPAFNRAAISTNPTLVGLFPFLAFVTSTEEFDSALNEYVQQGYVQTKYRDILGCDSVNLQNTTGYYSRYTTSFVCNGIVQNSRSPCGVSTQDAPPLCADSCARFATSEEQIAMNTELCTNPSSNFLDQIRADFTNCALPADSLSVECIPGERNEPNDCGFSSNLQGLCLFCDASSPNATDSCCVGSKAESRCEGVVLPTFNNTSMPPVTTTVTSTASPTAGGSSGNDTRSNGLSGGAIAGIVVGSLLGFLLLLALIVLCCILVRKRRGSQKGSLLNQPTPQRRGQQQMAYASKPSSQNGYEVLPGGRVARMSALQSNHGDSPPQIGAVGAIPASRGYTASDSDPYGDSPESRNGARPPTTGRRTGSLSSNSMLAIGSEGSPQSNQFSSPEGVGSGQSEQLGFFKDYYSSGDIHPNDKVSVLWAYQPRAADEFELERGDMLKIVGIWDDGWATGVRIDDRAEEYDGKHKVQRDSGVSNGSNGRSESPPATGEIKAFPLVCVCLPDAWKKTVEGDTSTDSGTGGAGE